MTQGRGDKLGYASGLKPHCFKKKKKISRAKVPFSPIQVYPVVTPQVSLNSTQNEPLVTGTHLGVSIWWQPEELLTPHSNPPTNMRELIKALYIKIPSYKPTTHNILKK